MKKKALTFLIVGLLGLTLAIFAGRSSNAEANNDQQDLGATKVTQIEIIERDVIYDFKIPSQEQIAETKKVIKKSDDYKKEEKKYGKVQAEKNLDEKLRKEINYMKEKNKEGKGKIQLATLAATDAAVTAQANGIPYYGQKPYFTIWGYKANYFGLCTDIPEDPMNLLFWNHGSARDVSYILRYYVSPVWGSAAGGSQCAWTGTNDPGVLYASQLKRQTYQRQNGSFSIRHHMRIWSAPNDVSGKGEWSVAATHHEKLVGWSHCVDTLEGSENFVRTQMNNKWFSGPIVETQVGNQADLNKCGVSIANDGSMPFIELTYNATS